MLRSSRGVAKESGQLLPRRHPPQALSGSIVEKHLDPLEFLLANLSEGRLLGVKSADQAVGSTPCTPMLLAACPKRRASSRSPSPS